MTTTPLPRAECAGMVLAGPTVVLDLSRSFALNGAAR